MLQYKIADRLIPAGEGDTAQVVVLERADQGPCVLPSGMELSSLPAGEAAWTPRLAFGAGHISGSLALAQREKGEAGPRISFGLWPKGLLLLDESGAASQILSNMADHAIWKHPASPAQVFCRLLEGLADGDGALLREAESSLEALEEDVLGEKLDGLSERMLPLRKQIGRLLLQYGWESSLPRRGMLILPKPRPWPSRDLETGLPAWKIRRNTCGNMPPRSGRPTRLPLISGKIG